MDPYLMDPSQPGGGSLRPFSTPEEQQLARYLQQMEAAKAAPRAVGGPQAPAPQPTQGSGMQAAPAPSQGGLEGLVQRLYGAMGPALPPEYNYAPSEEAKAAGNRRLWSQAAANIGNIMMGAAPGQTPGEARDALMTQDEERAQAAYLSKLKRAEAFKGLLSTDLTDYMAYLAQGGEGDFAAFKALNSSSQGASNDFMIKVQMFQDAKRRETGDPNAVLDSTEMLEILRKADPGFTSFGIRFSPDGTPMTDMASLAQMVSDINEAQAGGAATGKTIGPIIEQLDAVPDAIESMQQSLALSEDWLAKAQGDQIPAGRLTQFMSWLGFTPESVANLNADTINLALEKLKGAGLTPVSNNDFEQMIRTFADIAGGKGAMKGALRSAVETQRRMLARNKLATKQRLIRLRKADPDLFDTYLSEDSHPWYREAWYGGSGASAPAAPAQADDPADDDLEDVTPGGKR